MTLIEDYKFKKTSTQANIIALDTLRINPFTEKKNSGDPSFTNLDYLLDPR